MRRSDRTTNAAHSIHVNYKVWSYWPGCPYYVSAMGTLITQTYWEMHWTPIEWQKQLHIPRHPDVILNPLTTQNHFHKSGNISDNTEHDCSEHKRPICCPRCHFAACIFIAVGSFSPNQSNMAQIHWQSMANPPLLWQFGKRNGKSEEATNTHMPTFECRS